MAGLQGRVRSVIEAATLSKDDLRARVEQADRLLRPPGLKRRADRERFADCLAVAVEDIIVRFAGRQVTNTGDLL